MRTLSSIGLLAISGLALSAGAQPVLPMCHTVQVPDSGSVTYENDRFVPMITVKWETFGHPDYPNPICLASPATAAKYAADWLRTAPWINETGSNIMLHIPGFGSEVVGSPFCPPTTGDDRQFFRPADMLPDYNGDEELANRHPFLYNATTSSRMKVWMTAFRDELRYWVEEEYELDIDLNNAQVAFDCEAEVTLQNADSVKMLAFLARNSTIWNTWKVPGSYDWAPAATHAGNTTGRTLADLYGKMVQATEGTDEPWPEDIFDLDDGLRVDESHEHPNNRKFALWFFSLCERAREGVMYASAYSVLNDVEDGWPGLRCSNYHAANHDEETIAPPTPTPTDTWFADKQFWSNDLFPDDEDAWNPAVNPQHYTQTLPRAALNPSQSGHLFEISNMGDRWLSYRRRSLSQQDAPELYQLSTVQWGGHELWQQRGHWSLNPYVPPTEQYDGTQSPGTRYPRAITDPTWAGWTYLQETRAQTRLAISRHTVESSINTGVGQHEDRLAPWTSAYIAGSYDPNAYRSAERENRMILGMLRAKKTENIKFWFSQILSEHPPQVQWEAFEDTRELVDRVWATDVTTVIGLIGDLHEPEVGGALEYTLRDENGADVMIGLESTETPPGVVAMEVVVRVPMTYKSDYNFEITLEAVVPAGVTGSMFALSRFNNLWEPVRTMEFTPSYKADTTAEWDAMDPADLRSIRRTFWLGGAPMGDGYNRFVHPPTQSRNYPHLLLRIYHDHADAGGTTSWFDLLQAVPVRQASDGIIGDADYALKLADLNADNCVDEADMTLFLEGYSNESPIADINRDEVVDELDIDLYLLAYYYE